ncbi:MAG: CstA-like transporter-associated (seleno)protein [Magnetococcus sp. MYC-9]
MPISLYWQRLAQMARAMIGFPDYAGYVAHCRLHHPGRSLPGEAEFLRQRQEARYGGGRGRTVRCC